MNVVFQLWQNVLLEWERCNIFDGFGDVLVCPPKLISKSAFNCLANLKETQLEKLAKGLLVKMITLRERLAKGRRLKLKSMHEFTRVLKRKVVI
jgi:hypothetical protein